MLRAVPTGRRAVLLLAVALAALAVVLATAHRTQERPQHARRSFPAFGRSR